MVFHQQIGIVVQVLTPVPLEGVIAIPTQIVQELFNVGRTTVVEISRRPEVIGLAKLTAAKVENKQFTNHTDFIFFRK